MQGRWDREASPKCDARQNVDELVEHSARLAQADDEMRWALIQARKEAGLSQRDVADMMGVEQSAVAAFEARTTTLACPPCVATRSLSGRVWNTA